MNLGFLASHNGSNMQAIIDACNKGKIQANPVIVISNNRDSKALQRAKSENIPAFHISSKTEGSEEKADKKILEKLKEHKVDLLLLAGYMRKISSKVINQYPNKIVNIHPSLLPKYGGQGMYGRFVHEAVLKAGEKETGVTIHLVNDEYDKGKILAQMKVPVEINDTVESLSKRVLAAEHSLYVETIAEMLNSNSG